MFKRKHPATGEKCVVNLKSGEAVLGVVTSQSGRFLFVHNAGVHTPGAIEAAKADGVIVVDTDNISFIQVGVA